MARQVHAAEDREPEKHRIEIPRHLKALGPGIISGASDNDPTTVATLSVVGSTTAYRLSLWLILLHPMLTTVQIISARIGAVTKRGLQRDVAWQYGRGWGFVPLVSVLAANLISIAADLGGGAAALHVYVWETIGGADGA
jgi:Mn2+/Fe2+ NRAMP family transporter